MNIAVILVLASAAIAGQTAPPGTEDVPVSTKWTLDATGPVQRQAINSVLLIICNKAGTKGAGFALKNGLIATAAHVTEGCESPDLFRVTPFGERVTFSRLARDTRRDLALLRPTKSMKDGLELDTSGRATVGVSVSTWGFPLGNNGPAPLLSIGYLAGFISSGDPKSPVKHLVVNGAFNSGNSGGPVFGGGTAKVIGVVVSKQIPPLTPQILSAINALAQNKSGVIYTATDGAGNVQSFVESQIVADLLVYYRSPSQVMIGEAVAAEELQAYLKEAENGLR